MDSAISGFWIAMTLSVFVSSIDHCYAKAITPNQLTREKRESGCCRDNEGGGHGGKDEGGCCQDDDGQHGGGKGGGGCCQDEEHGNEGHQDGGDCCQVNNNAGSAHAHQGGGCCQDTAGAAMPAKDPSEYHTGNAHPYGCCQQEEILANKPLPQQHQQEQIFANTPLPQQHHPSPQTRNVPLHKEEMMKSLLGEPFLENVRAGDENTLLFFSSMLAKLQSYMENLKFQMEEVRNDLHLKFQGFDNWSMHTDRVIDSAIALVRRRVYEVQWGETKHKDWKEERLA